MPDKHVFATDPLTLQVNDTMDALIIIRTHSDTWDEKQAEKAVVSHDGFGKFLMACVRNKKAVYDLIKELDRETQNQTQGEPEGSEQHDMEDQGR